MTSRCETNRRSASGWVCEAKGEAIDERLRDESPPLEQPKSSLCDSGDYVVIVEEVKSTVQAR